MKTTYVAWYPAYPKGNIVAQYRTEAAQSHESVRAKMIAKMIAQHVTMPSCEALESLSDRLRKIHHSVIKEYDTH